MQLESWPAKTYAYHLPMRFHLHGDPQKGVAICLHGYQDHALSMLRRIGWLESPSLPFATLAINAPFPVPVWTAEGFKEAYSWYFRDTARNFTIVSPSEIAERVAQLISDVGLMNTKSVLFGFSQGGYLAPFVAKHLPHVRALISLGSGYPLEPYQALNRKLQIHAIHGTKDERIPIQSSQEAHAELLRAGFTGKFHPISDLTHRVDPQVEPLIQSLITTQLAGG